MLNIRPLLFFSDEEVLNKEPKNMPQKILEESFVITRCYGKLNPTRSILLSNMLPFKEQHIAQSFDIGPHFLYIYAPK